MSVEISLAATYNSYVIFKIIQDHWPVTYLPIGPTCKGDEHPTYNLHSSRAMAVSLTIVSVSKQRCRLKALNRFLGLLCGVVCVMIFPTVLMQYQAVTDRHTTTAYITVGWHHLVKKFLFTVAHADILKQIPDVPVNTEGTALLFHRFFKTDHTTSSVM